MKLKTWITGSEDTTLTGIIIKYIVINAGIAISFNYYNVEKSYVAFMFAMLTSVFIYINSKQKGHAVWLYTLIGVSSYLTIYISNLDPIIFILAMALSMPVLMAIEIARFLSDGNEMWGVTLAILIYTVVYLLPHFIALYRIKSSPKA